MSFSKSAKRGITAFSKIQWSPSRAIYHLSQRAMINLNAVAPADPKLVTAASEAMEILVKNGEKANAELQSVPEGQGNTVTPSEEGSAPGGVPLQPGDNGQA